MPKKNYKDAWTSEDSDISAQMTNFLTKNVKEGRFTKFRNKTPEGIYKLLNEGERAVESQKTEGIIERIIRNPKTLSATEFPYLSQDSDKLIPTKPEPKENYIIIEEESKEDQIFSNEKSKLVTNEKQKEKLVSEAADDGEEFPNFQELLEALMNGHVRLEELVFPPAVVEKVLNKFINEDERH